MKIGLVPISAKPYHAGHHALVSAASAQNDKVLLFVSTSDRKRKGEFPILGSDMADIWVRYLEPIMPGNVEIVYGGSPVQKVYGTLENACMGGTKNVYTVYSDPEDTAANYPPANREKYFPGLCDIGTVKFAAEEDPGMFTRGVGTPNVSGTKIRAALAAGDISTFSAGMPAGVDAEAIFADLGGQPRLSVGSTNEDLLRSYVGAIIRG